MENTTYRDPARVTISEPTIYDYPGTTYPQCVLCGHVSGWGVAVEIDSMPERVAIESDHLQWKCHSCEGRWLSETYAQYAARRRMQWIQALKAVATLVAFVGLAVILFFVLGLLSGCGGVVGHLPRVSPHQDLIQAYGTTVTGEDCSAVVFGVQTRDTSVMVALDAALSTQQHVIGTEVHDVEIRSIDRGIWVLGERCIHVEGRLAP